MPNLVARIVKDKRWKPAELARRINVSRAHAGRLIKGERPVTVEIAARLENATGVPAAKFIWPKGEPQDSAEQRMVNVFRTLTADEQEQLIGIAQTFQKKRPPQVHSRLTHLHDVTELATYLLTCCNRRGYILPVAPIHPMPGRVFLPTLASSETGWPLFPGGQEREMADGKT